MSAGKQLSIDEQGAAALTRSRGEAFAVARARVLDPNSPNTQRAYRNAYKLWCSYCDALGIAWAPIEAPELVTYLEQLSVRCAPNTVRQHLAALCALDIASRVTPANPSPVSLRSHQVIQRWELSWSRDHPRAPRRRAAALDVSDLERLLRAAGEPKKGAAREGHLLRYVRDRCLILFGVCGALRGDDICRLELGDVESTERGLRLRLRASKTDQAGDGDTVGLLPQSRIALCPVDAFSTWKRLRGPTPGPLFVAITRSAELELGRALTERSVRRLIGEYAARAGLDLAVSAHSMRATFATLASAHGKSLARIMEHGRWKSAEVAASYVRQGQLFLDNASGGLLD